MRMLVQIVAEWKGIADSSDQISGSKRAKSELVADMGSSSAGPLHERR